MGRTALFIVDVQNDFLPPDGSLAVPRGREIIPVIGSLLDRSTWDWDLVIATQDYHPPGHISFATTHPPHQPFTELEVTDIRGKRYAQMLWPDHCVQGTRGAEIDKEIRVHLNRWNDRLKIVRKACHKCLEAMSAFEGYVTEGSSPSEPPADVISGDKRITKDLTEVEDLLKNHSIEQVVVTGVATEYCVLATSLASMRASFPTMVIAPAVRAVRDGSERDTYEKITGKGGIVIEGEEGVWERDLRDRLLT